LQVFYGEPPGVGMLGNLLGFIPITLLYTWLYVNTRGSLLLVTLLHVSQQMTATRLGSIDSPAEEALVWPAAIMIIRVGGPARLICGRGLDSLG
jgi:membrane protease YdiL (CAAX protease family)